MFFLNVKFYLLLIVVIDINDFDYVFLSVNKNGPIFSVYSETIKFKIFWF